MSGKECRHRLCLISENKQKFRNLDLRDEHELKYHPCCESSRTFFHEANFYCEHGHKLYDTDYGYMKIFWKRVLFVMVMILLLGFVAGFVSHQFLQEPFPIESGPRPTPTPGPLSPSRTPIPTPTPGTPSPTPTPTPTPLPTPNCALSTDNLAKFGETSETYYDE